MNNELRQIVAQVEQLDPVVQNAIVKEFQRVVKVVANMAPGDLMPWDEQFGRFTMRARTVLHLAKEEALRLNHPALGTEHLLLGLIREGEGVAARVLKQLGVGDLERVRDQVEAITGRGGHAVEGEPSWTTRARQVFALAKEEAQRLKAGHIGTEHLLLGLLREGEGLGAGVLAMLGIDLAEARRQTLRVIGKEE
jgi:ATP-dependent Clp protease ATP-binding subunit ClpC